MPNHNTFSIKPIREFIGEVPIKSADPFARNSDLATITNDLNPEFPTNYNIDAKRVTAFFLRLEERDS